MNQVMLMKHGTERIVLNGRKILKWNTNRYWIIILGAPPPDNKNTIRTKWIFKVKKNANKTVLYFKVRLVAQEYTQSPGIDYDEVFAFLRSLHNYRDLYTIVLFIFYVIITC